MRRRRFGYAEVAATLALVLSMGGGAMAAQHYLISSTKQISPKVLKKLQGARGATGATGAVGATGGLGQQGSTGATGPAGIGPAFGAFNDGPVLFPNTNAVSVATLSSLPAGSYAITAKADVLDSGSGSQLICVLAAESDNDTDYIATAATQLRSVATFQLLHTFSAAGGSVQLQCAADASNKFTLSDVKIQAVQVSSAATAAVTG